MNKDTNSCSNPCKFFFFFFCWSQEELLLDPSNTFPSQWSFAWIVKACLFKRKMRTAETSIAPCEGELLDQCSSLGNYWLFCTNNSNVTVIFILKSLYLQFMVFQ